MTAVPQIEELTVLAKDIRTSECVKYLPQITSAPQNAVEAERVLRHLAAIVAKETCVAEADGDYGGGGVEDDAALANQMALNLSFRAYFQLLHKHQLEDKRYACLASQQLQLTTRTHRNACAFQALFAILLTEHWARHLNANEVLERCLQALHVAVEQASNSITLLAILKALNLLCSKATPTLELHIPLEHIYHCLQRQNQTQGLREETLIVFQHCCRSRAAAFGYFQLVAGFWPWTNRNKFYLLSCILNAYSLSELLAAGEHSSDEFFAGVRLSLSYKSLLAASQYLVKTLSVKQQSLQLLELAAEVLTRGTLREIQNFQSQWFSRIVQKDELFDLLQQQPEIARFLEDSSNGGSDSSVPNTTDHYRLILIFSMFSRQIFAASKLHFFKISTELITNCAQYAVEPQLLIFRFIVDNFANFAVEDCLDFIGAFVQRHRDVADAQIRNSILGKMPMVINYVAKQYARCLLPAVAAGSTLAASIRHFFAQLQALIEADVGAGAYQSKIFALKLLELLLRSLYAPQLQRNAKNCILAQNQQLGAYLREQGVFHAPPMCERLVALLNDPLGFDDALALIVSLLRQLSYSNAAESFQLCVACCGSRDIDACALSALYAQVAMQSFKAAGDEEKPAALFEYALGAVVRDLACFKSDPLLACKTKNHLFGFLNVVNEIVGFSGRLYAAASFQSLLQLLDDILNNVLDALNLANLRGSATCASFQDMDESLQLLVQESELPTVAAEQEDCRKFLLMSFWLTLKACCDLATTLGCALTRSCESSVADLDALEQCLHINVAVLTRCRHKGAIEAAGLSIGKLAKCITGTLPSEAKAYALLHNCLELLFFDKDASDAGKTQEVSTTRRGAGFSIMFLHIVKNEEQRHRPILKRAIANILKRLQKASSLSSLSAAATTQKDHEETAANSKTTQNCDSVEALTLHYLCVLVRDTELRDAMSKYHNEIMMAAIVQIDNCDWTVCNAALQLFGALVPKIVGQKQATDFEQPLAWEPTELTYSEVARQLPRTCEYILEYCATKSDCSTAATRSIILFLGFLAKVEHLRKDADVALEENSLLLSFRRLMWRLLRHPCEKVRKLASVCFVRAHEFRCDLPAALLQIAEVVFRVRNENFFEGLVYTLVEGVAKLQHESKHTLEPTELLFFMQKLRSTLADGFQLPNFKFYTLSKLLDLLQSIGLDGQTPAVSELVQLQLKDGIGHDMWAEKVAQIAE